MSKILTDRQTRSSNLELYRIITMLLIVAHHYVVNSGLSALDGPIYADPLSWKSLFLLIFGAWGKIGINCFVLITGYFMCASNITAKKFMKLFSEIMIYRIIIYFIFVLIGYSDFSVAGFIEMLIPIKSVTQNFDGCYMLFYLTIPFLNILLKNMDEKMHLKLVLLMFVIYIFFGTVPFFSVNMNYVSWFIVLYFIGSYIRLYPKKIFTNTRFWGWMTMGCIALCICSVVACTWLGTLLDRNMAYFFVTDSNTFLAVATGVASFLFFKNLKIKNSKVINKIAASTFGVLLIHANSDTMRQWLWKDTLNNVAMYDSDWLVLHAIGCVLVIYVICTLIDFVYFKVIEKPLFKLWEKQWKKIQLKMKEYGVYE